VTRDNGVDSFVDVDHRGVMTEWHHRGATVLVGEAGKLLHLSGIEVPDGQMRRHRSYSAPDSCGVQMKIGKVSYDCSASIDLLDDTLRVDRVVYNGEAKAMRRRHATVLGVSLLGTASPKVRDGKGRSVAEETFPLGETVVRPYGAAFAVELNGRSLLCASEARVTYDDEYRPAAEPELSLLVHRTKDILYVGAAVCDEDSGLVLPPQYGLQISSTVTLG
jgi:hypothetical protein